CHQHNSYPWTF
nr:immunoglobulin light chain junction region [Macaca mulatta]MOV62334.1 immunoglobulin light chain junction region [Macaca mulatta]MOV63379.1 immunoglobulin light chain junction region [Macaca mulatta]MOV63465.1 immunoglobulin light chain junction region [Macaca mulatta]MOV64056.1 immunoglobulin light chain junction region [Macaca mulatta]